MKITISSHQEFANEFNKISPDTFSYSALIALSEYYEELENNTETELEFDPVAFRCEWSEYSSIEECYEDYNSDLNEQKAECQEYYGEDFDEDDGDQLGAWLAERLEEDGHLILLDGDGVLYNRY